MIFLNVFFNAPSFAEQKKGRLVIGTPTAEPFAGEDLEKGGFYPELIKEIFHRTGYEVKVKFLPFKRILQMLEQGTLTGAALVSYKKDRTRFLIYPENELYVDNLKVFGLKGGKTLEKFTGPESLQGSIVGTFRGGFVEKELAGIGVTYESVSTNQQNIRKLLLGRVDFIILPEMPLKYLLKQQFTLDEQTRIIGYDPPYKVDKHFVAFSKAFPNALEISKDFTHGLYLIQEDGTFDRIKAKYNLPEK
ncbi:MAG: transporter substrate-binding domain-containing protein [Desulfobacula sp.]|nr:transporter substrate-binding domain-containing protein [Desulfobacula sp.]